MGFFAEHRDSRDPLDACTLRPVNLALVSDEWDEGGNLMECDFAASTSRKMVAYSIDLVLIWY